MINRTRQDWTPGQNVKVGFLTLTVRRAIATPGDYAPDAYLLTNLAGTQIYRFVPHKGLTKITPEQADEMIQEASDRADRTVAQAIAKAQQAVRVSSLF